jgi:hypothetical protein
MHCSNCGAALAQTAKFCANCGLPIGAQSKATSASKKNTSSGTQWKVVLIIGLTILGVILGSSFVQGNPIAGRIAGFVILGFAIALATQVLKIGWPKGSFSKFAVVWLGAWICLASLATQSPAEAAASLAKLKAEQPDEYLEQVRKRDGEDAYFGQLRILNPERFAAEKAQIVEAELSKIKQDTPQLWLRALKEKKPQEYEDLQAAIVSRTAKLRTEVLAVPAADVAKNADLYAELYALNPDDASIKAKYEDYSRKAQKAEWVRKSCTADEGLLAGGYAKDLVKRRLKAPSTAKFPWIVEGVHMGDCVYRVSSYVDSQNGFGAQIRTNYVAEVKHIEGGWLLVDLDTY